MTERPPTLELAADAKGPEPPEVLFKEARRRRRRRWIIGTAAVVIAASIGVGLGVSGSGGNQPARPSPSASKSATSGAPSKLTPKASAAVVPPSPLLLTMSFFNPTDGYGLFKTGCHIAVGKTTDGGGQFSPLVPVDTCGSWTPAQTSVGLAFDDHGDGFAYGPRLFVTHDAGASWAADPQPGIVLSVEALGYSVWMLEADCPGVRTFTRTATTRTCKIELFESTDGGRTWTPSPAQPSPGAVTLGRKAAPGSLVRVSPTSAYVVMSQTSFSHSLSATTTGGTVPLWSTTDGGRSWVEREIPCGIDNGMHPVGAAVSAAPDGTLFAMCAWFTQVGGSEDKAVFVSTDNGAMWSPRGCTQFVGDKCARSGLEGGYLKTLDAVSSTTAYEFGQRGRVLETTDGGWTWAAGTVGATATAPHSTGPTALVFFDATHGVALGMTNIWHTNDGAESWTRVVPVVVDPSAPPCTAGELQVGRGAGATADGHVLDVVLLKDEGSVCTLGGDPLLSGISTTGEHVGISTGGMPFFGTLTPTVLSHGERGQFWLETATTCDGPTHARVDNLVIGLPGEGGTVSLGGMSLTLACFITASRLGVPPESSAPLGSVASLSVGIEPRFVSGLPGTVIGGSLLHYTVTLYNLTSVAVRMVPCPRYTVVFRANTGTSKAERVLSRDTASFACRTLKSVPPGRTAHVTLSVRVPTVPPTTAGFVWKFDVPGVVTAPKTTSTTGIGESGMKIFTARAAAQNGAK